MQVGRLAARALIGGLFVGHGTQKLFGWFGGPGQDGTRQMMEALELRPARHHALAAGATETASGALLALGLGTPLAAAGVIGTMATAVRKVHLSNGPWVTNGGYEYNLVLMATCVALAESGPGDLSLDHVLGAERTGTRWALLALALGLGASAAVIEYGRRTSQADAGSAYPTGPVAAAAEEHPAGDPATADRATS
jgi:putative oxidoreductase